MNNFLIKKTAIIASHWVLISLIMTIVDILSLLVFNNIIDELSFYSNGFYSLVISIHTKSSFSLAICIAYLHSVMSSINTHLAQLQFQNEWF